MFVCAFDEVVAFDPVSAKEIGKWWEVELETNSDAAGEIEQAETVIPKLHDEGLAVTTKGKYTLALEELLGRNI